jgi:hypothetical protein
MKKYLNAYKNCFSKGDLEVMAKKIDNIARVDFEKEVDEMVKAYARKISGNDMSEDDDEDNVEIKNSYGNMFYPETKVAKTGRQTIDDVLNSLNIK